MEKTFSTELANEIYNGGADLQLVIETLNFAIKYPLIENKITDDQKIDFKQLLTEIIELLDKTPQQIIAEYDMDDVDSE